MIEVTASTLAAHPFLRGMPCTHLDALAEVGSDVKFPAGYQIFEEGGFASRFWLIQSGHAALDMNVPGDGQVIVDSVGMGELLGCSWLFPPYRWAFGAVCAGPLEAFEFDAAAIRARCAADPVFGYELHERLIRVFSRRVQRTRTQLIARSARTGAETAAARDWQ
jgi:CRP/FNR family transcriptional regulator, cyclic AMP receptor protein